MVLRDRLASKKPQWLFNIGVCEWSAYYYQSAQYGVGFSGSCSTILLSP